MLLLRVRLLSSSEPSEPEPFLVLYLPAQHSFKPSTTLACQGSQRAVTQTRLRRVYIVLITLFIHAAKQVFHFHKPTLEITALQLTVWVPICRKTSFHYVYSLQSSVLSTESSKQSRSSRWVRLSSLIRFLHIVIPSNLAQTTYNSLVVRSKSFGSTSYFSAELLCR